MKALFWFRRDLRLDDNQGLFRALKENDEVVPLFIFDSNILKELEDDDDPRVTFIYYEILKLKKRLEELGSSLQIKYGDPLRVFKEIVPECGICRVYTNHDYEPYARDRDKKVADYLRSKQIEFMSFKDQVVFERDDILKENGEPYTVFTPYKNRWRSIFHVDTLPDYDTSIHLPNFLRTDAFPTPSLEDIGFKKSGITFPSAKIDRDLIQAYDRTRDIPSIRGTSRLSVHLRFGTISIRRLIKTAALTNDTFLDELIWREFYMMILWHYPYVSERSFKPKYDHIPWRNNEDEFTAWCEGKTGYPLVDAGMREMNETGFMHNRLRMLTAAFLTKLLLIDWRWGEAYFARKLLDFELSSNNGGWQWSAGTGCDAAPYFRIFNPDTQTRRFDPDQKYIAKWIPELRTEQYPGPIVEYRLARQRALETYKKALD